MKTNKNVVPFILLLACFMTGCDKEPPPPPPPCISCNTHPSYELSLVTYLGSDGIHISTATLIGQFTYPVIVKWYTNYVHYRKQNKADTLATPVEHQSFYQYKASDINGNFRLECEATMANGVTLTTSTRY